MIYYKKIIEILEETNKKFVIYHSSKVVHYDHSFV